MRNYQCRGKSYQPSRRRVRITLTERLIILHITKTESDNCFIIHLSLFPRAIDAFRPRKCLKRKMHNMKQKYRKNVVAMPNH